MKTVTKLAVSRVRHNKSGTILTGVAFMLTACLLMAVGSMGIGLYRSDKEIVLSSQGNQHAAFLSVTPEQVETLKLHQNVESLRTIEYYAGIVFEKMNAALYSEAILLPGVRANFLAEGRAPEAADEISSSPAFFERLGYENPKLGDVVEIPYRVLNEGEVVTSRFTITGLLSQGETPMPDMADTRIVYGAWVSGARADTLPENRRAYRAFIRVPGEENLNHAAIEEAVYEIAENVGIVESYVDINDNYLNYATNMGLQMTGAIVGISVLIALFAALVIYSIYYVSVIANVQELGKLRAFGASRRQIRGLLLREGIITALVSLPMGIALGYIIARVCMFVLMSWFWGAAGSVSVSILSLPVVLFVIALVLVTAALSLLKPMRQASKISPISPTV